MIKCYLGKRRYNIELWQTFTDCFNCLPVAAIINEKIFCVNGGKDSFLNRFLFHIWWYKNNCENIRSITWSSNNRPDSTDCASNRYTWCRYDIKLLFFFLKFTILFNQGLLCDLLWYGIYHFFLSCFTFILFQVWTGWWYSRLAWTWPWCFI